ncbi:transforming acidic coiled-coil-containing protein 3 [Arapaima gigas]
MSSAVNDENCGVFSPTKDSSSEVIDDIFTTAHPVGRPSILRQSQADNLLSKSAPKATKVCFQTPRRDPLTNRIVSPPKCLGMADQCSEAYSKLYPDLSFVVTGVNCSTNLLIQCQEDSMPVYTLDFDSKEEAMNHLQDSDLLAISLGKTGPAENPQLFQSCKAEETTIVLQGQLSAMTIKSEAVLDDTLPFVPMDGAVTDLSTERSSSESSFIVEVKHPSEMSVTSGQECKAINHDVQANNPDACNSPASLKEPLDFDSITTNSFEAEKSKLENSTAPVTSPQVLQLMQGSPVLPAVDLGSEIPMTEVSKSPSDTLDKVDQTESVSIVPEVSPLLQQSDKPAVQEEHPTVPKTVIEVPSLLQGITGPGPTDRCSQITDAEEEFVPGTTFLCTTFDEQIDYLEQFGSSTFKESALRKQSLYLKFDPLLRDSPKKTLAGSCQLGDLPLPVAFARRLETCESEAEKQLCGEKSGGLSSKEDFLPLVADPSFLSDSLVPHLPQPGAAEDAIIEVLQYSQKDMDTALAKAYKEAKERDDEWKARYDKVCSDNYEMAKIMSDFETTVSQITAKNQQENSSLQEELKKVQQEKEQVVLDLSAMERSFSEVFKRLEKYKEIIEGYKKNEDTLKKCAQDYLSRIKKEEQRYQTLKAHAEEKIALANGEITQMRTKQKAEMSALQAQLRREQLKVQTLEKSLEQKVKETEELTKLCDDLIVNVQKR